MKQMVGDFRFVLLVIPVFCALKSVEDYLTGVLCRSSADVNFSDMIKIAFATFSYTRSDNAAFPLTRKYF